MPKTGLTLGKYIPFQKGHQSIIETAISEMDEVIVIIYDSPNQTDIPLSVRANWIRKLYPTVTVLEAWGGPKETGYTPEIMKTQEDFIIKILSGREVTHFYSSELYGEHVSKALGAIDRRIDNTRELCPVSATCIRNNTYDRSIRSFINPVVYKDLITHIVFMGAPSAGKSTITAEAAKAFDTVYMPEYGREYWDTHQVDRRLTLGQLEEIALGHIEREDKVVYEANKYLFIDTNAITTYIFSKYYYNGVSTPVLQHLAEKCPSRYDLFFLCDTDIPYDDTWDRSGEGNREVFHRWTIDYLESHRIPYIVLRGSVKERLKIIFDVLSKFKKFNNYFGGLYDL
jgi:NadR type nicotinamide-nucleotide adenylyltransferase